MKARSMNLRWTQRFDGNSIITGFDIEYKNKSGMLSTGPTRAAVPPALPGLPCWVSPGTSELPSEANTPAPTSAQAPVCGFQTEARNPWGRWRDPQLMGKRCQLLLSRTVPGPRPTEWSDLKQFKAPEPRAVRCVCGVRSIMGLTRSSGRSWIGMIGMTRGPYQEWVVGGWKSLEKISSKFPPPGSPPKPLP